MGNSCFIDFDTINAMLPEYCERFKTARPFPSLVIDNFLTETALSELDLTSLNTVASSLERSSDFVFAKEKIENPNIAEISSGLERLKFELLGQRFREFLQAVTGENVFLDPDFVGGGLHQGGENSFLEMHADFSRHPVSRNWIREFNILLYLNEDWRPEYGGSLDLKNSDTGEETSIEPVKNRLVIMLTKGHTLHGYKKISFPKGTYRTSLAAYAYKLDDGNSSVAYRSTSWHPQNKNKKILAKLLGVLTPVKQRYFGSRTARRVKKKDSLDT